MKIDEQLIRAVTAAVVEQLQKNGQLHSDTVRNISEKKEENKLAGRMRMKPKKEILKQLQKKNKNDLPSVGFL